MSTNDELRALMAEIGVPLTLTSVGDIGVGKVALAWIAAINSLPALLDRIEALEAEVVQTENVALAAIEKRKAAEAENARLTELLAAR